MDLTIFTALSLRKPTGASDLEKRFIEPLAARIFGDYPELEYLEAIRRDAMPDNARVIEFFFEPGSLLNAPHAQAHYLAANYTRGARTAAPGRERDRARRGQARDRRQRRDQPGQQSRCHRGPAAPTWRSCAPPDSPS